MAYKLEKFWNNGAPHDGVLNSYLCGGQQFWGNGAPAKLMTGNESPTPRLATWRIDPVFLGTNTH